MEKKICSKCKVPKELEEFHKDKNGKNKVKSKCKLCFKKYYQNNIPRIKKYCKQYNKIKDKQKRREYDKEYVKNKRKNIGFKIKQNLRTYLNTKLKNQKQNKFNSIINLINCTIPFLLKHLENQFLKGMTWENHGIVWEIDHITPCSKFDLSDPKQQKECFVYTNLMPRFKTTEIAEQFGSDQIGNRDKYNKLI